MKSLYNIGILIFTALAKLIAPFNSKASQWVNGRRNWYEKLKQKIGPDDEYIWMHCASLGEFEQGRPVIEALKKNKPGIKIVLTFFSPSGYEIRKNYPGADVIIYLPADTPGNAAKFISLVSPRKVIFVKYEFWNNYISELDKRKIPLYLISGIFRKDQHFFSWYGSFFRKILGRFTWFYVQDENSAGLLKELGLNNVTVAGDTRFDRVVEITKSAKDIPVIEKFRSGEKLFLAGSSWKPDEEIIAAYINKYPGRMKWVFAPHEIGPENIDRLQALFSVGSARYSEYNESDSGARVLIIDNIGMLSSAYRYASIAEVGGGFGKGIHNILEPACWGIPVLFGPKYTKFREAVELREAGGAGSFGDYAGFEKILNAWLSDKEVYRKAAEVSGKYVAEHTGATGKILTGIG